MESEAWIVCSCGRRVIGSDVLQKGRFLRVFSPGFVYLKYRCSHCKRVEERFVPEQTWDEAALREVPAEASREERRRFEAMGAITLEEAMDFHFQIENRSLSCFRDDLEA